MYHFIGGKLDFPLVGPSTLRVEPWNKRTSFLTNFPLGICDWFAWGSYGVNDDVFSYWEWGAGSGNNLQDARATVYQLFACNGFCLISKIHQYKHYLTYFAKNMRNVPDVFWDVLPRLLGPKICSMSEKQLWRWTLKEDLHFTLLLNMMIFLEFRLMQNSRLFYEFSLSWRLEMIWVFHLTKVPRHLSMPAPGEGRTQGARGKEWWGPRFFFPDVFFLGGKCGSCPVALWDRITEV